MIHVPFLQTTTGIISPHFTNEMHHGIAKNGAASAPPSWVQLLLAERHSQLSTIKQMGANIPFCREKPILIFST